MYIEKEKENTQTPSPTEETGSSPLTNANADTGDVTAESKHNGSSPLFLNIPLPKPCE